ncbi:MAG: LacI family DNA-binding transcriptional regulator [Planctomycetota bacterium]|nr:LacI family DNA-binding transcriptional regulator [Planctomycetota bacterium]
MAGTQDVTVEEVARTAGVSASTVSRVFNSNPDIADETAAMVRSVAARLGYRRVTLRGRPAAWKTQRTNTIAFLVPDVHQEALRTVLMGRILEGIESSLRAQRLSLMLAGLSANRQLPACLEPPCVDGLIVRMVGLGASLSRLERQLPDLPRVWVLEPPAPPAKGDLVHVDNDAVARLALTHFLEVGCRAVAVWNPLPQHPAARARASAFCKVASASAVDTTVHAGRGGLARLAQGLRSARKPVGLFVPIGDEQVDALYHLLERLTLRTGRDVLVVACDNDLARAAALDPQGSSIDIRGEEIGKAATELLVWHLANPHEPARRVLVEPRLVAHKGDRVGGH